MDASARFNGIRVVGSGMRRVLGVALGAATLISLIKSGFALDLSGLPAKLHQDYVWLRDMLYEPIAMGARYFGWVIPSWFKDTTIAYGLVAAAHWWAFRADVMKQKLMLHTTPEAIAIMAEPEVNLGVTTDIRPAYRRAMRITAATSILGALFWPVFHFVLHLRMSRLDARTMVEIPRPRSQAMSVNPVLHYARWKEQLRAAASVVQALRRTVLLNLFIIVVLAASFFLWNHVQNVFGPAM